MMPTDAKPITASQLRSLDRGLRAEIRSLERARGQLGFVDQEVFNAGMDLFDDVAALGYWLSQPASALGGRTPLAAIRSRKWRKELLNLLGTLNDGGVV